MGYMALDEVTRDYKRLHGVKSGYTRLQEVLSG